MLKLPLTSSIYTEIDDADLLLVSGFPWLPLKPKAPGTTYAHAWNGRQSMYMHRLIVGAAPKDVVDHSDFNGLNNQRWNLRTATPTQSQRYRNKSRNATSRFKGVFWDKSRSRWSATIHYEGKTWSLGRFHTEEDAAHAYDTVALREFGTFARLNFPVDNGVACIRHQLGVPEAYCAC